MPELVPILISVSLALFVILVVFSQHYKDFAHNYAVGYSHKQLALLNQTWQYKIESEKLIESTRLKIEVSTVVRDAKVELFTQAANAFSEIATWLDNPDFTLVDAQLRKAKKVIELAATASRTIDEEFIICQCAHRRLGQASIKLNAAQNQHGDQIDLSQIEDMLRQAKRLMARSPDCDSREYEQVYVAARLASDEIAALQQKANLSLSEYLTPQQEAVVFSGEEALDALYQQACQLRDGWQQVAA